MSPIPREGSIMYLPPLGEINPPLEAGPKSPEPKAFDHPVVVLAVDFATQQASILVITSFSGMSLEEKHRRRRVRERYVPLPPADEHPDSGRLLEFEHDMELKKASYVKIKPLYFVPLRVLRKMRERRAYVLTAASRSLLLEVSGLEPSLVGTTGEMASLASLSQSALVPGYETLPLGRQTSSFNQQGNHGLLRLISAETPSVPTNETHRLPSPVSVSNGGEPKSGLFYTPTLKCLYFTLVLVGITMYVIWSSLLN